MMGVMTLKANRRCDRRSEPGEAMAMPPLLGMRATSYGDAHALKSYLLALLSTMALASAFIFAAACSGVIVPFRASVKFFAIIS